MEIKIPKEIRQHRETLFFGLSTRQFLCAILAVGTAVGVYFLLKNVDVPNPPPSCHRAGYCNG